MKRYARVPEPDQPRRPPQYRACLVDATATTCLPVASPSPVFRLHAKTKALSYTGGLNLLYKYVNQGRLDSDRITPHQDG
ncbi:hypothetical protein ACIBG0_40760 [Nocardia sp. NPDC050630]|uniref:hypothetical protein n=1 Tax=Nocardia sp. NPDC050630 TaxID=3364321 RepID=UPI0037B0E295